MKCPKCGKKMTIETLKTNDNTTAKFLVCHDCKVKSKAKVASKPKRKTIILILSVILLAILLVVGIITAITKNMKSKNVPLKLEEYTEEPVDDKFLSGISPLDPFELDLASGIYTAGIDFPEGIYDLIAVSGKGHVVSSNTDGNNVSAVFANPVSDYSLDSSQDIRLVKGTTLTVYGNLILKITSEKTNTNEWVSREISPLEPFMLGPGTYTSNVEFLAGAYTLMCVEGSGKVTALSMSGETFEITMGMEPEELIMNEFKNILFEEGSTLTITDVTIQLVPIG